MLPFEIKETLLEIKNVNKSYGKDMILRDISIVIKNLTRENLKQGQIVSLVGKSGSGKSTLFRILAGLEAPDSGSVNVMARGLNPKVENIYMTKVVEEGDMGVVFQNSYVYPWRKVRTILEMAAKKNPELTDRKAAIAEYASLLNLEDHLNKYSSQLSGGQRQRVAIAEQILNGGNFILMDEPFSGLDSITIDKVTETLTKIVGVDEYKTIIVVSHDLSNALAISDTAFILAKQEGKEGATITHQIDLASQGLAWQPGIKENPLFRDLLKQVKSLL